MSHRGFFIGFDTMLELDPEFVPCPAGHVRRYIFVPVVGDFLTMESLLQAVIRTVQADEWIVAAHVDDTRLGGVWFRLDVTEEALDEPRLRLEAMGDLKLRILRLTEGTG